jgi:hypothetical protein
MDEVSPRAGDRPSSLSVDGSPAEPALALAQALGVAGILDAVHAVIGSETARIQLAALVGSPVPERFEREVRRRYAETMMTLPDAYRSVTRDVAAGAWRP